MKKSAIFSILILIAFSAAGVRTCPATEPSMSTYTNYPIFMVESVKPNILILLDNSGSMNFCAYGTWPGDGGTVADSPFTGAPYCSGLIEVRVGQSSDDAEERHGDGYSYYNSDDMDLGRDISASHPNQINGMRFQNIDLSPGAIIINAYIEFETRAVYSGAQADIFLTIQGEAVDDAQTFSTISQNISTRVTTTASVDWTVAPWPNAAELHQTPDLSTVIQEIVNRPGWTRNNSIALIITNQDDPPNSGRMASAWDHNPSKAPLLHIEYASGGQCKTYCGYFDPEAQYNYASGEFTRETVADPGEWDGNWLNWLCMRRVDIARKVLVGGLATSRTGGGNTTLIGDDHSAQSHRHFKKWFDDTEEAVCPYTGNHCYGIKGGYIYVDTDADPYNGYSERYIIKVKKSDVDEPEVFKDGNIAGILQRVADKARWGLEFFNTDSEGGQISVSVSAGDTTNMVTGIQNTKAQTWTPLAEALYTAAGYFKQTAEEKYHAGDYTINDLNDPYYWNELGNTPEECFAYCCKSFVLLITDGESTMDITDIPEWLQDYDGDGHDPGTYASSGSDYLDDVALWAHTTDLRTGEHLPDKQVLTLYTVFAFGAGSQLLKDAAKNGGFEDKNGNDIPDLPSEWDEDGDGMPDSYFEAEDPGELEAMLLAAITDILKRAASGTAVSVLATSSEGEGNLVQAYFRPVVIEGTEEIKWVGNLQSLWVDKYGNMREDTDNENPDIKALDINVDKVIKYHVDGAGNTSIRRFNVDVNPYPDVENDEYITLQMDEILPIWEAGNALSQRSPGDRKIFTFIDKDEDQVIDDETLDDDPFDDDGEAVRFHIGGISNIKPYLGVRDDATWGYLGTTHDDRANNLIQFIRGNDSGFTGPTQIRSRTIEGITNRLGDIVYSTPVSVSKPAENLALIYSDESYYRYRHAYKNRETVIYVGANDGMLHAFTSWEYDSASKAFIKPTDHGDPEIPLEPQVNIGDELWAYIPQALLPHLKWLPSEAYTHVYYVDLKPRVTDVQVFFEDDGVTPLADHPDGWGTILIGGLNMGGKEIPVTDDFDYDGATADTQRNFSSCYFAIDITKPREPKLLWEKSFTDLNLTTSYPATLRVKDKWFAVFGSGPSDYDGTSSDKGHVFVVDVLTGEPYMHNGTDDWLFEADAGAAFMSAPASFDKNLNYNVDAVYIGEAHDLGSNRLGAIYKVTIPWVGTGEYGNTVTDYIDDPNDATNPWTMHCLFNSLAPITAAPTLSIDFSDNVWVYFGTGRYFNNDDQSSSQQQYFFGIKDPFFNETRDPSFYLNYETTLTLQQSDLFDADPYDITTSKKVYVEGVLLEVAGEEDVYKFSNFIKWARKEDGWVRSLQVSSPAERVLNKPVIIGGVVLASAFTPNADICSFGGNSALYALYFETGTAFTHAAFKDGTEEITVGTGTAERVLDRQALGLGLASSVGIHVGGEEGAKGFVQQSTGAVGELPITPAFDIQSGLTSWIER